MTSAKSSEILGKGQGTTITTQDLGSPEAANCRRQIEKNKIKRTGGQGGRGDKGSLIYACCVVSSGPTSRWMRASRCRLCSTSVLHCRTENGDSPLRFHPALRQMCEGELFFHLLLFSCLLLKIILMLKSHLLGWSALLPFSRTEHSLKATIRHLANHLMRTPTT